MRISRIPQQESTQDRQWRLFAKHPLDLFPLFRRWAPSRFRSYIYTALICFIVITVIVIINVAFGHWPSLQQIKQYAVIATCIGFSQQLIFNVFEALTERLHIRRQTVLGAISIVVAPMLGLYIGFAIAALILGSAQWFSWLFSASSLISNSFIVSVVALFLWYSTSNSEKLHAAQLAESEANAREAAAKRDAVNAELKALRAQVEPHFLYNTLANVVSLIDRDPPQAKRMTERLIGYMRHTLDASRRDNATVADELAIIGDYLAILRLRMGERLNYAIVADDATRALPLPPMLLQPLIENAVKHGLEPKIDGGQIYVHASTQDSELRLVIEDSGLGFGTSTDTAGAGTGLANVRARLAALYGESARLEIESGILESDDNSNFAEPKRVVSTRIKITIPLGF
jgi:sensor histidine kinase YesM